MGRTAKDLAAITVGAPTPLDGQVVLAPHDRAWPALYEAQAARVRAALGARGLPVHHLGSTSVPGLEAILARAAG